MISNINKAYNYFVNYAKGLDNFVIGQKEDVPYDITELANGYCKACDENDDVKRNQYISALMVRYWHVLVLIYNKSLFTRLDFEDFIHWVYCGIEKACSYRVWMDETTEFGKDPKGAEKAINRCIYSFQQCQYYNYNRDKRKADFVTTSLDDFVPGEDNKKEGKTYLDTISNPEDDTTVDDGRRFVQQYIDKGTDKDLIRAIILDAVMYHDCFINSSSTEVTGVDEETGEDIEVTHYDSKFSATKMVKHLKNLNTNFLDYFLNTYNVSNEKLTYIVEKIKSKGNPTLHSWLEKTFDCVKNNKEILNWLCM